MTESESDGMQLSREEYTKLACSGSLSRGVVSFVLSSAIIKYSINKVMQFLKKQNINWGVRRGLGKLDTDILADALKRGGVDKSGKIVEKMGFNELLEKGVEEKIIKTGFFEKKALKKEISDILKKNTLLAESRESAIKAAASRGLEGSALTSAVEKQTLDLFLEGEGGVALEGATKTEAMEAAARLAALDTQTMIAAALGPVGWAIGTVLDVLTILTIVMAVDFGIEDAATEDIGAGFMCNFMEGQSLGEMSSDCSNGKFIDGKCEPCRQIVNMKDYESGYENKYDQLKGTGKSNTKNYDHVFGSFSPSVTKKLTSLMCKKGKDDITFAKRSFPVGGCVYWDYSGEDQFRGPDGENWVKDHKFDITTFPEAYVNGFTFLTNDINDCDIKWDYEDKVPDVVIEDGDLVPARADGGNDQAAKMKFKQMEYIVGSPTQEVGKCTEEDITFGNYFENFSCMWGYHNEVHRELTGWGAYIGNLVGETGSYPMPQMGNENITSYDGPNVCNEGNLELAGSIIKDMDYNNDPTNQPLNKNINDKVDVSSHCCPKIIGGPKCPHYVSSGPINITTPASPVGGGLSFDPDKNMYDDDTNNCYILGSGTEIINITHPEFMPFNLLNMTGQNLDYMKIVGQSNKGISKFRRGGIHCGPKQQNIASPHGQTEGQAEYTLDGETYFHELNGDNVIDVIRNTDSKKANQKLSDYYGTRLKLNNDYNYYYDEDSGATGYENYLDPDNYVYLPCHKNNNCLHSKFLNPGWVTNFEWTDHEKSIFDIDEYTTVNDVVARENGHPDRMKPLCDNIICNDLEKTKYMQTVYDTMCTNYDSDNISRNNYKKFYRPAGIEKYDQKVVTEDIHKYSDICCSPIPFSNKSAFVGCDIEGENSYFIDNIITDYNQDERKFMPTLPKEIYTGPDGGKKVVERTRINPERGEKQNLNQCIPSEEDRCSISSEYNSHLVSSPYTEDQVAYLFRQKVKKCSEKIHEYKLKQINKYNDKKYMDTSDISSEDMCNYELDGNICSFDWAGRKTDYEMYKLRDASPVEEGEYTPSPANFLTSSPEYWKFNRLPEGYVPTKGRLTDKFNGWSSTKIKTNEGTRDNLFDFKLDKPDNSRYTKCNAIPYDIGIKDIEIYDNSIDWDEDENKLRYIGTSPPRGEEQVANHFKIKCKYYDNMQRDKLNTIINSESYIPSQKAGVNNIYHYDVSCSPDPSSYMGAHACSSPGPENGNTLEIFEIFKGGPTTDKDVDNYLSENCANYNP